MYHYICKEQKLTMKKIISILAPVLTAIFFLGCSKNHHQQTVGVDFQEVVPDTLRFTNAEFSYNGDDIGEGASDGWIIKLYTDMDIDESGAPIGPGCVMQLLLNARYDEEQAADPSLLKGRYGEMMNTMNFAPMTFVSGYMTSVSLPGGNRLDFADATYYADVREHSTEMDYDLLDEGNLTISANHDGTYSIEGVLVGKKYTKRHFTWSGEVQVSSNATEQTPNSTLKADYTGMTFSKGLLLDKKDYFYLQDESYRCLLLFLVSDDVEFSYGKPSGTGSVLRLEVLVPWKTDYKDGIPAGEYTMIRRNEDTSMDREKIVPGGAVSGLPDVFESWKLSGSWFYEMDGGAWTQTYARIDDGTITIERGTDGSHIVAYDLSDCQDKPKRIEGRTTLASMETY